MCGEEFLCQIRKISGKVDLSDEFPDWNKTVQFNVKGDPELSFYFVVRDNKLAEVATGKLANPDVVLEGDHQAMTDLFAGRLPVIGAFITKKLTITGAIGDAVGANVLLQAARIF